MTNVPAGGAAAPLCRDRNGAARRSALRLRTLLLASAFAGVASAARADNETFQLGPVQVQLGLSGGAGFFSVENSQFGAGSRDVRSVRDYTEGVRSNPGDPIKSPNWFEFNLKPELRASYQIDKNNTISVDVSAIYSQTLMDGDANLNSLTQGKPGSIQPEEAWIAWKGPTIFGLPGDSTVVQVGRQAFTVDDGFLIADGTVDAGRRADFYLAPRVAFDGFATFKFNTSPVRGDVFILRNSVDNPLTYGRNDFAIDQPKTSFVGFDAQWFQNASTKDANGAVNYADRAKYVGVTYLHVYDSDVRPGLYDSSLVGATRRDGLNVYSLSFGGTLVPIPYLGIADNFTLYGQYVKESNSTAFDEVDAEAYYIEPGYTFTTLPWSPRVYYRYSHFSGQNSSVNDPSVAKRSYDPLFYGSGVRSAFGTYFYGEIIGQYVQGNTNQNVNQVGLTVTAPFHLFKQEDGLKFDAIYYSFDYDHPEQYGATSKHLADEFDVIGEYALDPNTNVYGAFGVAFPGRGGREAIAATQATYGVSTGLNKNTYLAELFFTRAF